MLLLGRSPFARIITSEQNTWCEPLSDDDFSVTSSIQIKSCNKRRDRVAMSTTQIELGCFFQQITVGQSNKCHSSQSSYWNTSVLLFEQSLCKCSWHRSFQWSTNGWLRAQELSCDVECLTNFIVNLNLEADPPKVFKESSSEDELVGGS